MAMLPFAAGAFLPSAAPTSLVDGLRFVQRGALSLFIGVAGEVTTRSRFGDSQAVASFYLGVTVGDVLGARRHRRAHCIPAPWVRWRSSPPSWSSSALAFSHIALINTALNLNRVVNPAKQRSGEPGSSENVVRGRSAT